MNEEGINIGGVNGTGLGYVNTNSQSFKAVRQAIEENYKNQTPEERLKYRLFGLSRKMKAYVTPEYKGEELSVSHFLKEHINALGIKHKDFAHYLDLKESNFSAIMNGKRRLSIELAYKLGEIFEASPSIWLLIQNKNELLLMGQKSFSKKYRLDDLLGKVG